MPSGNFHVALPWCLHVVFSCLCVFCKLSFSKGVILWLKFWQEVEARNHSMCCVVCHKELAKFTVKNEKELASVDLVSRLQKLINNGSRSMLLNWLSCGDQQAFMIPTNQLAKTSHLASQMQGFLSKLFLAL